MGVCPKHLAGNESEVERTTASSEIRERTLGELSLVPFEAAAGAGAWAVMTGSTAPPAPPPWPPGEVLRGVCDFDGLMVPDWLGSRSTARGARHRDAGATVGPSREAERRRGAG